MEKIGWREWLALPTLGIDRIKAKIDTGARTSCLHAFRIEPIVREGAPWLGLWVHPDQHSSREAHCEIAVSDEREVTDSGGHIEQRFVIESEVELASRRWLIEMTLTNRDSMKFRMLLGRTAMKGRFLVDPAASFLAGAKHEHRHTLT